MSALWYKWQSGCISTELRKKYETTIFQSNIDGEDVILAVKTGSDTPPCYFADFARECIDPHPPECIFHERAVELTQEVFPETRSLPVHLLSWRVMTDATARLGSYEIYCPSEGVDRRAEFGISS